MTPNRWRVYEQRQREYVTAMQRKPGQRQRQRTDRTKPKKKKKKREDNRYIDRNKANNNSLLEAWAFGNIWTKAIKKSLTRETIDWKTSLAPTSNMCVIFVAIFCNLTVLAFALYRYIYLLCTLHVSHMPTATLFTKTIRKMRYRISSIKSCALLFATRIWPLLHWYLTLSHVICRSLFLVFVLFFFYSILNSCCHFHLI